MTVVVWSGISKDASKACDGTISLFSSSLSPSRLPILLLLLRLSSSSIFSLRISLSLLSPNQYNLQVHDIGARWPRLQQPAHLPEESV